MTELTELQILQNRVTLIERKLEGGLESPIHAVRDEIGKYYQRLSEYRKAWDNEKRDYQKAFDDLSKLDKRFKEIEKFMRYLLDFFDPNPKAKRELDQLKKIIKEKDAEIDKTRSILKTALK